jgi:hypothetical protein
MDKRHIAVLVLFSIGIKIVYLLFSMSLTVANGTLYDSYIGLVKKNDAHWYERIAVNGYPEIRKKEEIGFSEGKHYKQSEWAFFPFYPLLNRGTSWLLNVDFDRSAFVWSILFSMAAIIGAYWFGVAFFNDQRLALFNSVLLFSFPFSFYHSMFYTEALFLSFLVYCFLSIYYGRYLLLMVLLIPLTLIRPNGIIALVPLYLYHLERKGFLQKLRVKWMDIFSIKNAQQSLFFVSAPLALFFYCLYQYKMTGFYFAFTIAQDGWYREWTFPLLSFFRSGDFATQFNSIYTILVILFAFWVRKALPASFNALVFLSLLLPLCSGSVWSMARYVSVIFPLFMGLSYIIHRTRYQYFILSLCFVFQLFSLYWWIMNYPVSY